MWSNSAEENGTVYERQLKYHPQIQEAQQIVHLVDRLNAEYESDLIEPPGAAVAEPIETASTVLTELAIDYTPSMVPLPQEEDQQSVTSFASSASESGVLKLKPPPPPLLEGEFECPYCFLITTPENWQ